MHAAPGRGGKVGTEKGRLRRAARAAVLLVIALAWIVGLLRLRHATILPPLLHEFFLAAYFAATAAALVAWGGRRRSAALLLVIAAGWLPLLFQHPRTDREWNADQERLPRAAFDGDRVTIENVRHAAYRSVSDFDVHWETRTYDLSNLGSVEYVIEPFSSWQGLAHTFLTFGFEDGERVALSVEIRKERGESYDPIAGLFRQYELMYVVADERDLIGLRAFHRRNPVTIYPVRCSRETARRMLESMLERANALAERPEFYHSITSTCTSNIVRHMREMGDGAPQFDRRLLFPGYSDELAFELGLIDTELPLEQAREHFRVPEDEPAAQDGREWSRRIRPWLGE